MPATMATVVAVVPDARGTRRKSSPRSDWTSAPPAGTSGSTTILLTRTATPMAAARCASMPLRPSWEGQIPSMWGRSLRPV